MNELPLLEIFLRLGVALGLGLIVGLQRERIASRVAGFRTFPLLTILGSLSGLLALDLGGWIVAAAILALAIVILVGNLAKISSGDPTPGLTTEMAMLVMFGVGVLLAVGPIPVGVAVAGVVAALLQFKEELHGFAKRIGDEDFKAMIQFVLIALVILPILPDEAYGPYGVLNPRQIWLLVVLIVGISLGGYIAYKVWGHRAGSLLGGIIGGFVSSTATTVSYSRHASRGGIDEAAAARVILLSSSVVFARLLLEIGIVAPTFLEQAFWPLFVLGTVLGVIAVAGWVQTHGETEEMPPQANPTQLRSALAFTAFFAIVLVAVPWAQEFLGTAGSYVVAALSGLSKMDAITLSTAKLVQGGTVDPEIGWRMIIVASLANLAFKLGVVRLWGPPTLFRRLALWWGVGGAAGIAILVFWP